MTTATTTTTDHHDALARLAPPARHIADLALQCGWRLRTTHRDGLTFTSPTPPHQVLAFDKRGHMNQNVARSYLAKIARYTPDADYEAAVAALGTAERARPALAARNVPPAPPAPAPAPAERRVWVAENPWMAKRAKSGGEGHYYESPTTMETHWSDGTTTYRCRFPDCDYTADTGAAVARHWGRRKDHPSIGGNQKAAVHAGPEWETNHHPDTTGRVGRLADELRDALAAIDLTDDLGELAHRLAAEVVAQRQSHGTDDEPRGPLTAEERLDRVRRLVDDGTYLATVTLNAQLAAQLAEQAARLEQAEATMAEFHALADLMASYRTTNEGK